MTTQRLEELIRGKNEKSCKAIGFAMKAALDKKEEKQDAKR